MQPAPALALRRDALVDDASVDLLDAALCLVQAAWAAGRPGWDMPPEIDPIERLIFTAGH